MRLKACSSHVERRMNLPERPGLLPTVWLWNKVGLWKIGVSTRLRPEIHPRPPVDLAANLLYP